MDEGKQPEDVLRDFINILGNIKQTVKNRKKALDRMFWEYNNCNVDLFEDRESKIQKYIPQKPVYPRAFLASNLGFNRSTMDSKYMEILNKFKLEKKSSSGSIRNALHYEILKHLIIKYFERSKK